MSKIIGIDLGTSNSVVAVMEDGIPIIIPNAEGNRTTPSVVAFTKDGRRLAGITAKRQAVVNPENTIYSVKRLLGLRFDDFETRHLQRTVSYQIVAGPNNDARIFIPINNRVYSPQEISAIILGRLKQDAENYLGEDVTQAVITVPAYFNASQRQATKDAGQIAGMEVLRIINEPTAAAIAYGLDQKEDELILVLHLGGGSCDVSVLEVGDGVIEVKSTNGNTHLGGDDWDEHIVDWLIEMFSKAHDVDLNRNPQTLQRLRESAEKAKIELSSVSRTDINLPFITADDIGPKHLQFFLSRNQFERLTDDLVKRCRVPIENALRDAGISASQLDKAVLVGGSTRMPMILNLVKKFIDKDPYKGIHPDEAIAFGAALQAGVLSGDMTDLLLLDVTPLSLGLETSGGVMTVQIPRNTSIPTNKTEIFSTYENNQTAIDIHILQGERRMANQNKTLGKFRLDGIPMAPRGVPQIEVTFDMDANGILHVIAKNKATGQEQSLKVIAPTNLAEEEKERLKYTQKYKREDVVSRILYTNIPRIESLTEQLKTVRQTNDLNRAKEIAEELQQASADLVQMIQHTLR